MFRCAGAGAATSEFRYKAFISYSWSDRAEAERLHHALETYRAPKGLGGRRLHPIFRDREEEAAAASIGEAIEAAMGNSEFLIVLCSPRAAVSPWVNREVAWFKTHRDSQKILAVIVDGEPMASAMAGREAEECFPATLLRKLGADLQPTDDFEDAPLAADAREAGDGRRGAKLKLAAAMLGVGLDTLVNRDNRRRAQRRRLVMSAMAASMTVLAGITVYAVNQRNAAIAAKKDAEFQRDEAQSLVEFMLTDLRQRLDAVGRLDILDAVAKRLLESYEEQDLAALDPDSLGRRARVLLLLGEVEGTRGKLDAALARYKEAAATTEELLRRDPDNQQRIFDHAQSVYWVGDIALKRGDMPAVTDYWTQYRDFGARLVALDPDKDEWRTELGYGHRNLGVLAFNEGQASDAVEAFSRARDVSKALSEKYPDDANLQIVYADDLIWLASAQEKAGAFAKAEETLFTEVAISSALLAKDPENDMALQRQSVNRRMAARLAIAQGDARRSLEILQGLIPLHEARIAHDPDNTTWMEFHARLLAEIASSFLALSETDSARPVARRAMAQAQRLSDMDPTIGEWALQVLCNAATIATFVELEEGELNPARAIVAQMESRLDKVRATAAASNDINRCELSVAVAKIRLAHAGGDHNTARFGSRELIDTIDLADERFGPFFQTYIIELALEAGDTAKAVALAEQLYALGFRHPDFMKLRAELASQKGGEGTETAQ